MTTSSSPPDPVSASPAPAPDARPDSDDRKALSDAPPSGATDEASSSSPTSPSSEKEAGPDSGADTDKPDSAADLASSSPQPPLSAWQAIWSPAHNVYYFYNATTQETTWTNPLQSSTPEASTSTASEAPVASSSTATPAQLSHMQELQAAAIAQGIDPSLAYLDPSLAAAPAMEGYTAKFNARTGTFTRPDGRDPSHLSEFERAKRMSEFYFDVNQWQEEVAARDLEEEAEGKKRKRPTKKDLERYKEQKKAKKIAKTAWLRT